jgi:hypothetical protein
MPMSICLDSVFLVLCSVVATLCCGAPVGQEQQVVWCGAGDVVSVVSFFSGQENSTSGFSAAESSF